MPNKLSKAELKEGALLPKVIDRMVDASQMTDELKVKTKLIVKSASQTFLLGLVEESAKKADSLVDHGTQGNTAAALHGVVEDLADSAAFLIGVRRQGESSEIDEPEELLFIECSLAGDESSLMDNTSVDGADLA